MALDLKVLICDDSVLIRKKLSSALKKCKVTEVLEAENGEVGVSLAKEHKPNLVFMDIVMPDKDGIQALSEIKEFDDRIKVVMASSAGTQSHLKKALELGAYDFIQKPVTLEAITNLIEKIIKEESEGVRSV